MVCDVAGGENIRVGCAPQFVDHNPVIRLAPRRVGQFRIGDQPEADHGRCAFDGNAIGQDRARHASVSLEMVDRCVEPNIDAVALMYLQQPLREFRRQRPATELVEGFDQGDLGALLARRRRDFQPDPAAADDPLADVDFDEVRAELP